MEKGSSDWRKLAIAFYALAHQDPRPFKALPPSLQDSQIGQLCTAYLQSGDPALLDQAGYLLTGTRQWYVYLGRSL
ncbi:MAG: hypothetical protein JW862_19750 [Anaerolineales bacterium]|nr:hypothetical protein [Anaerolineales bacterium]